MIDEVSESLGEMTEKVVFLGGAVTSLLVTDTALSDIRPTKDVDVITVVDGREELPAEIRRTHIKLRKYIQKYLATFEKNYQFRDAIAGYLPTDPESQKRFSVIIDRIQTIIAG
jgi:hypothetical protein